MEKSITPQDKDVMLHREKDDLALQTKSDRILAGLAANRAAQDNAFPDYQARKSQNTLRRQKADLRLFEAYLRSAGLEDVHALYEDANQWHGITWGEIKLFGNWMILQGYSIGSVNVRLSTVRQYAHLAFEAGVIPETENLKVNAAKGFSRKEGIAIDEKREAELINTRVGSKKKDWVALSKNQAALLKQQPTNENTAETPQIRRDRVLLCLLLDHGLRCGEMALLETSRVNLETRMFEFYRPKIDLWQNHLLTDDAHAAILAYMKTDISNNELLLLPSLKNGELVPNASGMSVQGITARVKLLGKKIGIPNLSAHDCRHYWVTAALSHDTHIDRLQQAGGWASPAMPLRYATAAEIANEGVKTS